MAPGTGPPVSQRSPRTRKCNQNVELPHNLGMQPDEAPAAPYDRLNQEADREQIKAAAADRLASKPMS